MAHGQAVDLDWTHPAAAEFIQSEDQMKLHAPFAKPTTFDTNVGKFVSLRPYADLEHALRLALPEVLGLEVPQKTTTEGWDILCDKVLNTQKDYTERQQGTWRKIWHGVGKASDNVDVWVGWIPDEFGLTVVKVGLALVIKLAGKSLERRQKILIAFEGIKQAMASADPRKVSFQAHKDVVKASKSLYQAGLDSIENLILLTKLDKPTSMRATLVHHDITENHKIVNDRMYSLERQNSNLKKTIKAESRRTAQQCAEMYEQNLKKVLAEAEARARRQEEQEITYKNEMMAVILESRRDKAEHNRLVRKEQSRRVKRGPIIAPGDFWRLFAEHMIEENGPEERYVSDDEASINHPVVDLEYVLMYRGSVRARASSQTQTLLRHDRFLTWMNQANPDLILVNANIRPAAQGKVTAMSMFCGDLVGCLATARPEDVIIHFFCGLHADYDDEPFPGPAGLVRSLILQVFLKLVSRDHLDLDFLHDWNMVEALRARNLEAMCGTLHELLHGFPAGTRVFCIIDSISMLETSDTFEELEVVLQCLRDIVEDRQLRAFFKVLIANTATCSVELQSLPVFEEKPDRIVNLSSGGLMPGMSSRGMRRHISSSSSQTFSMADLGRMGGRPRSHHEYDSDEGY